MTPIPLTSPTGALYGYACGACHHMRTAGDTLGTGDGPDPMLVRGSLREATECCRCPTCGEQEALDGLCPACPPVEMTAAEFSASLDALEADPFRVAVASVLAELATRARCSCPWHGRFYVLTSGHQPALIRERDRRTSAGRELGGPIVVTPVSSTQPASIALLSSLDAPPAWIAWARPATFAEQREHGIDVVFTLDLDEGREPGSTPAGVARVSFAVRWRGEPVVPSVATWMVDRAHPEHVTPVRRWLADVRRDLRRRGEKHGQTYTEERIHVLDPRGETHAPRRILVPQKK